MTTMTDGLARARSRWTTPRPVVGLHRVGLRPAEVALLAVWYGLATGLLELGLLLALKPLHDPSPGFFRMNRHALWMIPAVNLAVFGTAGLLLMAVTWFSPVRARARRWAVSPSSRFGRRS